MEREPNIFGKDLGPEDKESVIEHLEQWKERAVEPIEGELEKTPEELKFVEMINMYLQEELEEVGVEDVPLMTAKEIHILPSQIFREKYPDAEGNGFFDATNQVAYIGRGEQGRLAHWKTIGHELLHIASAKKYHADKEEGRVGAARVGYVMRNYPAKTSTVHEHFRGLDEAMTDQVLLQVFNKHEEEFINEFKIESEEQQSGVPYYHAYLDVLQTVIEKIAERGNEDTHEVWQRFKRGYFTGELMHLKDVERTFGKGALRVLGALGSDEKNIEDEEVLSQFLRYFETDDEKEREHIAQEILSEKEREAYERRRK